MSFSLWGDEQWSWRESVGGRFQRDATSSTLETHQNALVWEQIAWDQTVWRYQTTNHHFLFAIAARVSNGVWQALAGAADYGFSEAALRFAPLLFGAIGIALWTRLAFNLGAWAAALTAVLLALHPWYLRYLTEARGYPLLFALVPSILLLLRSACRSGSRRAWIGVALCQVAAVYAWPGIIFALAGIQIAVFAYLRRVKADVPNRSQWRWFLTNTASAMLLFQLMAPCFPQVIDYLSAEVPSRSVGLHWIANELSWFALGCDSHDFNGYATRNPLFITAQSLLTNHPFGTSATLILIAAATFIGGRLWWQRAELGRPILAGFIVSAAMIWAAAAITGTALYSWYFVYLLPLFVLLIALGIVEIAQRITKAIPVSGKIESVLTGGFALAAVVLLASTYRFQIASIRTQSMDPRRESVALTRPPELAIDDPAQLDIITAHCNQPALAYDPHGWLITEANAAPDDPPGLIQLMRLADTTGATLWVNVGGVDALEKEFPEIAEQLKSTEMFERQPAVHGLAPQFERHLYRYRGGMFDFLKGL